MTTWTVYWEEDIGEYIPFFVEKNKLFFYHEEALNFSKFLVSSFYPSDVRKVHVETGAFTNSTTNIHRNESLLSDNPEIKKITQLILFSQLPKKHTPKEKLFTIIKKYLKSKNEEKYRKSLFNFLKVNKKLEMDALKTIQNFKQSDLNYFLSMIAFMKQDLNLDP